MVAKKNGTKPEDKWADAREILIVAGTPVRKALEKDEHCEGIYLGYVQRESKEFGQVNMHLFETPEGMMGMWGHHALDEGLKRSEVGVDTRIDGKGMVELDNKKNMRLVRVRQTGGRVAGVPIIDAAQRKRDADAVFEALGIDGQYAMDSNTGEVVERQGAAEHQKGVFEDGAR